MDNIRFDNHDCRIQYYPLYLERSLDGLPVCSLPDGYRFVFYRPGDRDHWIAIEQSAKEFRSYEKGLESWQLYYGGKDPELAHRMVFLENFQGEKVATATAFYDIAGNNPPGCGWLHWVAVRRDYQGHGLAKPLITYTLQVMRELGYTRAMIPTQTTTWLACKVYLDLGFRPVPSNAAGSRDGWRIIRALTGHPALAGFDAASLQEILRSEDEPAP